MEGERKKSKNGMVVAEEALVNNRQLVRNGGIHHGVGDGANHGSDDGTHHGDSDGANHGSDDVPRHGSDDGTHHGDDDGTHHGIQENENQLFKERNGKEDSNCNSIPNPKSVVVETHF